MRRGRPILEALFQIRRGETKTALLLFVQCFCVISAAFVVGRTLSTTLFLHRIDPAFLPYTYTLSAVGVSTVAVAYSRIADRFRRDHIVQATAVVFAALCVLFRITLRDSLWFLALVYVFFDIVGDISLIQLWTLASDVMSARQGKRLFAFVAAGGTIGGIVMGAVLGSAMRLLGAPSLFLVAAVLLLIGAIAARRLGAHHDLSAPRPSKRSSVRSSLAGDVARIAADKYTRTLAVLLAVGTLATIMVDYQWKLSAREAYLGDEEGLAAFFSYFAVATNGAALFVQLFVTSRLLERFGLRAGLGVLPGGLLAALGGALVAGGGAAVFWVTSLAKGVDGAFRYSVNDTSVLVLYRPIPARLRGRAKAIVGGVVKPLVAGLAGLGIAAFALAFTGMQLSWVAVPILLLWLGLVGVMRRLYVTRLSEQLSSRSSLEGDALSIDVQTRTTLKAALEGDDRERTVSALGLLETFDELPFALPLEALLAEDEEIAARTLELLATHGVVGDFDGIEGATEHPAPEVRARAIAVCLRHGGLGVLLSAARRLESMIDAEDAAVRRAAATTLAIVGEPRFFEPLRELLADPDSSVRAAAARAAARVANPSLIERLLELLAAPTTRTAAREALAAMGDAAIPALAAMLRGDSEPAALAAVRTLGDIGGSRAAEVLMGQLGPSSDPRGRRCAEVLGRLAEGEAVEATSVIEELAQAELDQALEVRRLVRALGQIEPSLLGDALEQRWRRCARHALALTSALSPGEAMADVTRAVMSRDPTRRGDALELLDNLPLGALGKRLLEVFDEGAHYALDPVPRAERLGALLEDPDPWIVSCAVYELALDESLAEFEARVEGHADPLVQETLASARSGIMMRRMSTLSVRMVRSSGGSV